MQEKNLTNIERELEVGQVFDGHIITSFNRIGDLLVVEVEDGQRRAYTVSSDPKQAPQRYSIGEDIIDHVLLPDGHQYMLLVAEAGMYLRDMNNQAIEDYSDWNDAYFEPITGHFYRQTKRGYYVDMNNHKLQTNIFLSDDVLISLPAKRSIQSFAFLGQPIKASRHYFLIQISKVVYNWKLEIQYYFDKKISGLLDQMVLVGENEYVVALSLGLDEVVFVFERTGDPFVCNGNPVQKYLGDYPSLETLYRRFESNGSEYLWNDRKGSFLSWESEAIAVQFDSIIRLDNKEFIGGMVNGDFCFVNMVSGEPFYISELAHQGPVVAIDPAVIKLNSKTYWNVSTKKESLVYSAQDETCLQLSSGQFPKRLIPIKGLESTYCQALTDQGSRIIRQEDYSFVHLGSAILAEIESKPGQKLFNARTAVDEQVVLDLRHSVRDMKKAMSGDEEILEMLGEPVEIGKTVWQNAKIKTLGGSKTLTLDINSDTLKTCCLPESLRSRKEPEEPSMYGGLIINFVNFENEIQIGDHRYVKATVQPFGEVSIDVLINKSSGYPLHVEGSGYKNELVTKLSSDKTVYQFGRHRMVQCHTLTEEFKENQLLISTSSRSSCLDFRNTVLPPFKRVLRIKGRKGGDFHLFEVRGASAEKEFYALECKSPHRLLVVKEEEKEVPLVIRSTKKELKTPKKLNAIQRLFLADPGYLTMVD